MNLIACSFKKVGAFSPLAGFLLVFGASITASATLPAATLGDTSRVDMMPLTVGNSWTFAPPHDSLHTITETIVDTVRLRGKLYFLNKGLTFDFSGKVLFPPPDTLHADSLGNIWQLVGGEEYLLFSFSVDSGGTYHAQTTYPGGNTVRVKRNQTVDVPAGRFRQCIDLYFLGAFADEDIGYVFAPGVGIVRWYGPWLGTHDLIRALINGNPVSSIPGPRVGVPTTVHLEQNYPNPFNPSTTIRYALPHRSQVTLAVFNMLGQKAAELVSSTREAGRHAVEFNAGNLASGAYFYRLQAGNFAETKRLVIVK